MKLFLLIMLSSISCAAEIVARTSSVNVTGTANTGEEYRIEIYVSDTLSDGSTKELVGLASDKRDGTKIKTFKIFVNGKPVIIPDRAYSDLADLHLYQIPTLTASNGELHLSFMGSDGAGSYDGTFTVKDNHLIGRKISEYWGQFENKTVTIDEKY